MTLDETHDPSRQSWVETANGHADFPIQNLPFGMFAGSDGRARAGVAIGDFIICLESAQAAGLLPMLGDEDVASVARLMSLPATTRLALRATLSDLLSNPVHRKAAEPLLHDSRRCQMLLPMPIGDYTDFYVGIHHATNIGKLFRPDNPLLDNYKWVPIGYHGRASSVHPSGVDFRRPLGQRRAPGADAPHFGPSTRLDFELELAVWIGEPVERGEGLPLDQAEAHIAGLGLLNDWSARDIQAWEYQPLGPFLAKNFHSTVSPWIVTTEALAPFHIATMPRPADDPQPLAYLDSPRDRASGGYAIELEVAILTAAMREAGMAPHVISRSHAAHMYWTVSQMVTHHVVNGCDLRTGDLLGTGTISSPTPEGYGSLMELTRGGGEPIALPGGETRSFVEDGDEILLSATARQDGYVPIGFGSCRAMVLPARDQR